MNMNKQDSFFMNKLSHELRNPLTSLHSTIQLIEHTHPQVKDFKYWDSLTLDIEYMIALLNDVSSFSFSQLSLSSFSLEAMIKQVALSFAALLADSQIQFTSKIDISHPIITGDYLKLQEVLRNLLKNAADACSCGDSIYLCATSSAQGLTICIKDTGMGISEENLSSIWNPFVTYKKQGSGLGLPICKQIIEAHKGEISLTSVLGEGTCVYIHLPLYFPCN